LTIKLARNANVPVLLKERALSKELPLADAPIPENIRKLQKICIEFGFENHKCLKIHCFQIF
jgi:hypothetical protein